jgi:hypothetical protein
MSGGQANYPAEAHLRIDDKFLNDNISTVDAQINTIYLDGDPDHPDAYPNATGRAGQPRGIMIKGTAAGAGNAGVVRGYLWNETPAQADDYYLSAGIIHPLRFKRIYAQGTTARGIKVLF